MMTFGELYFKVKIRNEMKYNEMDEMKSVSEIEKSSIATKSAIHFRRFVNGNALNGSIK